ncbi:MAG: hypothetical protein QOD61_2213 [Solirubrobacteraceae bacterium]|nr:hypothetical protein [Solirubrobacteraceae bacterium]
MPVAGMGQPSSGRVQALDGVRGLAALSVMAFHWMLLTPAFPPGPTTGGLTQGLNWLAATPLRAFLAGPEMVLLFFVLSGLVLSLPFVDGRPNEVRAFLAARAFRIYPVAWLAAGVGLAVTLLPTSSGSRRVPLWLSAELHFPSSSWDPFHYLVLAVPFDPSRLDGPLWSMEQEVRVSLLFPVLLWALRRSRLAPVAVGSGLLIVLSTYLTPDITSWAWTGVPLGCFLLGMVIAHRQTALRTTWGRASAGTRSALVLGAGMCFWLPYLPPENVIARLYLVRLAPALGACLLLTAAFCGSRTAWLRSRACQWLGQISYGVYVWHAVILAGIVRALPAGVPPLALAPAGIAGTLVIGHLSYHLVERPVLTWGRRQIRGRSHQAGRSLAILGANSAPSPSRQ